VHDLLVGRLRPRPAQRWLDVATGTGEVAARAATAGADVTGIDISPAMVEFARANVPSARFEIADCERLPYGDGEFDVVSSCFGFIFAPNHRATARELARVCARRLGFTAWVPNPELRELYRSFGLESPEGRLPFEWGKREHVEELLARAFDLELEPHVWVLTGTSGHELWELWSRSAPPFKAMVEEMERDRREAFRAAYVEYCERYRDDGQVHVPRPYLLVLGTRR
jgi:SAM-dependent methyltransferase